MAQRPRYAISKKEGRAAAEELASYMHCETCAQNALAAINQLTMDTMTAAYALEGPNQQIDITKFNAGLVFQHELVLACLRIIKSTRERKEKGNDASIAS